MRTLSTEIDGLDQRAASRFGISRTDLRCIDVLRSTGPLTASDLARAVGLTSGGLSIALERLERYDDDELRLINDYLERTATAIEETAVDLHD